MRRTLTPTRLPEPCSRHPTASYVVIAAFAALVPSVVHAVQIDTGNPDYQLTFTNNVKYTAAWRVQEPSEKIAPSAQQPNVDFGDKSFDPGFINNRFDLYSELDFVAHKKYGLRLAGQAWYDTIYREDDTDFVGGIPNYQAALLGASNNQRRADAEDIMGHYAELMDAFAFGTFDLGSTKLTLRGGQHTVLFGETLFLGGNGIAAAQGPVDLIKANSLTNAQFKEIGLPVPQISASWRVTSDLTFGAYYQFMFRPLRIPAAGSYFSPADFVGDGADLLLSPAGPANRIDDKDPSDQGQWGIEAKFHFRDTDYGLYAGRYHEKAPIPVLDFTVPGAFGAGSYRLAYAEDVEFYGASFSTVFGETNVAGEVSARRNTPLAPLGDLIITTNPNWDNKDNTPYARGDTLHANLSAISVYGANALWEGASLVAELAYNHLIDVTFDTTNALGIRALNTTHTDDSLITRFVFQPEYFQVLNGVDLQVPIGVGYGIYGRSAVLQLIPEHGGDVSIGVNADFNKIWKAGLRYTHYFGPGGPAPDLPALGPTGTYASYKQYYDDRDFIALTFERSF